MQKTRGAALLAATALAVGGLAACGDEGEPGEASSTASPSAVGGESSSDSTSSSGSSSSGADGDREVAELPEAAQKKTKAGAIAFNEFYFTETGRALHTGNPEALEIYSEGCVVCDTLVQSIRADAQKGINMDRNPYTVDSSSARKRSDSGYRVELNLKVSEYSEVLKDGSKGRTAKAMSMTVVSDTQWHDGHWEMHDQVRIK